MESVVAKVQKWEKEAKVFAQNNASYNESFRKSEMERLRASWPTQEEFEIAYSYERKNYN